MKLNFHLLRLLLDKADDFEITARVQMEICLRTSGKIRFSIYDPDEGKTRNLSFASLSSALTFFD